MSEFGGLWTHKNNPLSMHSTCLSLQNVEAGHYTEDEMSDVLLLRNTTNTR